MFLYYVNKITVKVPTHKYVDFFTIFIKFVYLHLNAIILNTKKIKNHVGRIYVGNNTYFSGT